MTNRFTALNDGMAIASVVMLVGSTAFAFLGAPRLDARLTEPAQPISIGAAGSGMLALSAVLAYLAVTGRFASATTTCSLAVLVLLSVGVVVGAALPWLLLVRSL